MQVKHFMTRGWLRSRPTRTLLAAAKLMLDHRVGGLPVVDASGRVLGVFSETDLLREDGESTRLALAAYDGSGGREA